MDAQTGLIGIEEHWLHEGITAAQLRLPPDRRDDSMVLNDHGDASARLTDVGMGRLAAMDEQGVTMQVLSLAPPATQGLDASDAVSLARAANDVAAAAVAAAPDRLRAMATLPLADPAAAAAELERAAGLGLVGTMVHGRTGDVLLDDPRFDDLWAVAADLAQPVFVHPQIPPRSVRRASYAGIGDVADLAMATFAWGWHLEAGTAALRLMAAGTLDRHPTLQLVLGHWGELLLFWHDRADGLARAAGLQRSVTEYLRDNVWMTASGMLDPAMLHHALAVTTPDRVLFSTDYPFQQPTAAAIAAFLAEFDDDDARHAFAAGNARRLFRIDA
ncbi:amidohydrolase family protein [Curtobacterium sp. RRHDQ10]|uniref:amidohydrolase family protein n=1 Tax=Curtobacterium phyllosphaerae TaxID=3413379 RepID=UPI003BF4338E